MAKHNYLVSVFVNGRNENSYFSENLDDLATIKAMHNDCEISIFDLTNYTTMPKNQVESEIRKSGERWKKSLEVAKERSVQPAKKPVVRIVRKKKKKFWERRVVCVETGQIFPTIRYCSEKTGIPYMTIVNCIRRGNATRGVHFTNYIDKNR